MCVCVCVWRSQGSFEKSLTTRAAAVADQRARSMSFDRFLSIHLLLLHPLKLLVRVRVLRNIM